MILPLLILLLTWSTSWAQSAPRMVWERPVTRTDGAPLTVADLKGYRVYISRSPNVKAQPLQVRDHFYPTSLTARVTGLSNGVYYFCIAAVDLDGDEGECSNVMSGVVANDVPGSPGELVITFGGRGI